MENKDLKAKNKELKAKVEELEVEKSWRDFPDMMGKQVVQMSIKPILFNTEMVRANLDGRKSCTRRLVKGFVPDDAIWGYTAFTPKGYISCPG